MLRNLTIVCAAFLLCASSAYAQKRDMTLESKAVKLGYVRSSGATNQRHARDHATILYQAGKSSGMSAVPKEMCQEQTQAIRVKTEAAVKDFAKIKEMNPENKEVAASVEKIQQHHNQVLAMCKMLDDASKKGDAEHVTVCDCCLTMVKELDAAGKEAEKLRETLKIAPLTDPLHDHHEATKK
jgi:uncharacterized protein HemY